jgi:hypothetical protein
MIIARDISDALTGLVKKLDEAVSKYSEQKLGSFVVFCSDDDTLNRKLKDVAAANKIQHVVFGREKFEGPENYTIPKDADVTVVLYRKKKVKANYAFKKGAFTAEQVDKILRELPKLVEERE